MRLLNKGKLEVKLFLCLIKYHAKTTYKGVEALIHVLLNLELD
jgi:hypothetical protein